MNQRLVFRALLLWGGVCFFGKAYPQPKIQEFSIHGIRAGMSQSLVMKTLHPLIERFEANLGTEDGSFTYIATYSIKDDDDILIRYQPAHWPINIPLGHWDRSLAKWIITQERPYSGSSKAMSVSSDHLEYQGRNLARKGQDLTILENLLGPDDIPGLKEFSSWQLGAGSLNVWCSKDGILERFTLSVQE